MLLPKYKILVFIFLLPFSATTSYTQDFFPVDNSTNLVWEYATWYFWSGECESRIIRIGDEVLKCNQKYYEVIDCREDGVNCRVAGYVRHQNDSIMTRVNHERIFGVNDTLDCEEQEGLMYQFGIMDYDTISCQLNNQYPPPLRQFWSTHQEIIEYEGIERNTLSMSYHPYRLFNFPSIPNRIHHMKWIEGIGSTVHPFYSFPCFSGGCEKENGLMRVYEDGKLIYQNSEFITWFACSDWIGRESPQDDLSIYPNPSIDFIRLKSPKYLGKSFELKIFNLQGKLILHTNEYWMGDQIDIQNFPAGTYAIQLSDGKEFLINKLIKM